MVDALLDLCVRVLRVQVRWIQETRGDGWGGVPRDGAER